MDLSIGSDFVLNEYTNISLRGLFPEWTRFHWPRDVKKFQKSTQMRDGEKTNKRGFLQNNGSQPQDYFCPPREYQTMSGDVFGCHHWRGRWRSGGRSKQCVDATNI